jgi:hypothetical protein
MATWLHDVDVYETLANGEPGAARDWGTVRLALAAPAKYRVFPDDSRVHDVLMAAGPPALVPSLEDALRTRRPLPHGIADAAAALGMYGLIPEDPTSFADAVKSALRGDGAPADLWLAHALGIVGKADAVALAACAKADDDSAPWVLPTVLLRVAESMGQLDDAAVQVASELEAIREPHRVFGILAGLGVPIAALARPYESLEQAIGLGAAFAHQHAEVVKLPPGSVRRRQQQAVRTLLDGVAGPAAAVLRAVCAREVRAEWGMWPAAIASFLRGKSQPGGHHGHDAVHDVVHHASGSEPRLLSTARRELQDGARDDLAGALREYPDVATAVLALELVRRTGDAELAELIIGLHGGELESDIRTTALACAAAWHHADSVPGLLASENPKRRGLGLVLAEWTPTAEVLEALLAMPVPANTALRGQYARDLAAMAEAATVPALEALIRGDEGGSYSEARALAEELLRVSIA